MQPGGRASRLKVCAMKPYARKMEGEMEDKRPHGQSCGQPSGIGGSPGVKARREGVNGEEGDRQRGRAVPLGAGSVLRSWAAPCVGVRAHGITFILAA